jgi:hypothetical protein
LVLIIHILGSNTMSHWAGTTSERGKAKPLGVSLDPASVDAQRLPRVRKWRGRGLSIVGGSIIIS